MRVGGGEGRRMEGARKDVRVEGRVGEETRVQGRESERRGMRG